MPAFYDELGVAFDRYFGMDEQSWKSVDLLETTRIVVAQAGSRLKVGLHEDTNKNSHKYDPFRFSRVREAAASGGADSTTADTLSFVSTSPDFLAFSHAKHACPGRFLVDFELKMIIAYVLTHYDIQFPEEYDGQWPANRWMAEAVIPLRGVKLLVRRRKLNG